MELNLETLGISKAEIQERVIERIVDKVMSEYVCDEYGSEDSRPSRFAELLRQETKKRVDESIAALAEKHIFPNVHQYIENLTLQETNKWGEAKGEKLTFVEYLAARAESYLSEQVDFNGKSKAEGNSYTWSGRQTRITYLVHQHLQYSIERAMQDAVKTANSVIASGIAETVKIQLAEIAKKLKVQVSA